MINAATKPMFTTASTGTAIDRKFVEAAIAKACGRIAPLWPLRNFVAVNPFLGFADQSFEQTCATIRRVNRLDMLMPRAFYHEAAIAGIIEPADLEVARQNLSSIEKLPRSGTELLQLLANPPSAQMNKPAAVVATVAETLDRLAAGDRQASRTDFMISEISKWCEAYFDKGQSVWRLPSRGMRLYPAWRASMRHDCNPEMMGIRNFRSVVAGMPDEPVAAIVAVLEALGIPQRATEDYLYRALFDVAGWAGYVRCLVWNNTLHDRPDDSLVHLLALRLVWGYALFLERDDQAFITAWSDAMADAARLPADDELGEDTELAIDIIGQLAYDHAYQRKLMTQLAVARGAILVSQARQSRMAVQAAFCIDVRSEVYRRAFETVGQNVETLGFAGFFGFPIEYVPIGNAVGGPQCPVLLKPQFVVCETVQDATPEAEQHTLLTRRLRRRVAKAWKAFKLSAISSFSYVETTGLGFAAKLVGDSLSVTRPVDDPNIDGLDRNVMRRVGPRIEAEVIDGRQTGFETSQRIDMAEAVLRAMSMTGDVARLVLLTGHGSSTVNNPHGSGLDCGACGGHTGEANARVAAAVLNDPEVRTGLASRGIGVPSDTWFLGALHDTTTDDVKIFDADRAPASHLAEISQLNDWLAAASSLARLERASLLGIAAPEADQIKKRSRDWSQTRPEWGLAGNTTFIAAPRNVTRKVDLKGKAFLHSYDWRLDTDFRTLEMIMTAPMVVASWINLQYYASTVNNRAFGAGNKVLHNVTGTIGVLEGNAGDLKVGLPWQSVHDGSRFVHEPLRLNVFLAAPLDAINNVIQWHPNVRDLVENHWVHLFALPDGELTYRYRGELSWQSV